MINEEIKINLKDRGICIIIPTFNNEKTIADIVNRCLLQCYDVIVVNDGSTDNTSKILSQIANITLIEYTKNKGKGFALKQGFKKAISLGFAYAISIDADGQHYPEDISLFLETNKQKPQSLIIGKRNLNGVQRTKGSNFANKFSNFWFFVQTGKRLNDTQSGYRLYPLKKIPILQCISNKYESELALLVFSSWRNVKIVSIPINVYYPPKDERVSHFRPIKDFARISLLNTILCFLAVVYALPLKILKFIYKIIKTLYSFLFIVISTTGIITPFAFFYMRIGKITEKKRLVLHKIVYKVIRFIMLQHGIPSVKFSYFINDKATFSKPSLIICNHQSQLDLACQMIFTPKIVFLTNDWAYNNCIYGYLIKQLEYFPVSMGLEELIPKLQSLVDRGYSIAVYPEGTRSKDCKIGRFHKGAFFFAEALNLDIMPMYIYGTGKVFPKGSFLLKKGKIHIEVGKTINRNELATIGDLKCQASFFRKEYIKQYNKIANQLEQDV